MMEKRDRLIFGQSRHPPLEFQYSLLPFRVGMALLILLKIEKCPESVESGKRKLRADAL